MHPLDVVLALVALGELKFRGSGFSEPACGFKAGVNHGSPDSPSSISWALHSSLASLADADK